MMARELGLTRETVAFLDSVVNGEIGRRPASPATRLAWLAEMGLTPATEYRVGAHPLLAGLPLPAIEMVRKALAAFKMSVKRRDREHAAVTLATAVQKMPPADAQKAIRVLSVEDRSSWTRALAMGREMMRGPER